VPRGNIYCYVPHNPASEAGEVGVTPRRLPDAEIVIVATAVRDVQTINKYATDNDRFTFATVGLYVVSEV
jgi:hypothetical protein